MGISKCVEPLKFIPLTLLREQISYGFNRIVMTPFACDKITHFPSEITSPIMHLKNINKLSNKSTGILEWEKPYKCSIQRNDRNEHIHLTKFDKQSQMVFR